MLTVTRRAVVALAMLSLGVVCQSQDFGRFVGRVVAEWNRDPKARTMTLVEDFAYIDPSGARWDAPRGSVVDGASIPRAAWTLAGGPFEGRYREASVIHDVACDERRRPWQSVHRVFFNAMRAGGVPLGRAQAMYWAVRKFGPKWAPPGEVLGGGPTPPLSDAELQRVSAYIEQRAASGAPLSLDDVDEIQPQ